MATHAIATNIPCSLIPEIRKRARLTSSMNRQVLSRRKVFTNLGSWTHWPFGFTSERKQ